MAVREAADSAISYSVGGASILLAHLIEGAQALTVIGGMLIILVRLVTDCLRLYRIWKVEK